MIGKFIAKILRGPSIGRGVSTSKKMTRRIAIEPLESRRLLAVTGSLSGFAYLDTHDFGIKDADEAGFAGLTVQLKSRDSQGNLGVVSGVGPVQTLADGSYRFNGLAAGSYQIQISPSSKLAVGVPSVGSAGGTAGSNEVQVTLTAGQSASYYNFAILGAQTNQISLRMFTASTGSLTDFLTTLHTKPYMVAGSSGNSPSAAAGTRGSSTFTSTYTTGGPEVAIVPAIVTIASTDSPTLTAMTVTIQNPQDGSGEQLSADTTGTILTSNYANSVLTVSGVADVATYQTVLQTVRYRISSSPAHIGDRTLSIVVNDGTATSTVATSTITVVQGTQIAPSVTAPSVTTNPAPQTILASGTASFTAAASGNPTPTVQWQVNTGTGSSYGNLTDVGVYTGSNTGTLTITGTTLAMSGYQYKAVFTNAVGTPATTTAATLTVLANSFSVLAPPASVAIGSPVLIALNSVNSSTPTFSATTTSTNDPTGSKLTATHMPQTNQVLKIVTDQGEMDFQLFNNYTPSTVSHFVDLVNTNTYTNTSFYRIIQTFMIQGGSGGSGSTIPVELRGDLRFTSSGLLAMANNGVDGNSSEFFITSPNDTSNGFLDFRYTIFGKLIKGDNVRQAIAAKPVSTNSSGENSQPVTPLKILSMSITTDTQDGVLLLKALPEATGSYTVNVSDGLGGTQTFTINVGTNSFDPPNPWVTPINGTDKIFTAANTPATFTPQGVSADGSAAQVNVQLFRAVPVYPGDYVDNSYTGTSPAADAINPNMTLTQNGSSYTVTPTTGFYGVQVLEVTSQSATAAAWDAGSGVDPVYRAFVPVFVAPPAPQTDSISVNGQTVTGSTSANNSNSNTKLSFNVSGAISGATVSVYVDGIAAPIATGTVASGATSITLTTDGITTLPAGGRQFTVKQTIATSALSLFANFSTSTGSPGSQFQIPASSVASVASAGTALTIS